MTADKSANTNAAAERVAAKREESAEHYTIPAAAVARMACDEHGRGPSSDTIKQYVKDGLLHPIRDQNGRYLFRRSDIARALQIYKMRMDRKGATGCRIR